jgi:hypothetical protein
MIKTGNSLVCNSLAWHGSLSTRLGGHGRNRATGAANKAVTGQVIDIAH